MDILMPQLGETVAEGRITTWYKSVGDTVSAGDSLFEIETDKTSMDVPTTVPGVLSEIRVAAGATVPVGAVVAVLANATAAAARAPAAGRAVPASTSTSASASAAGPLDPFHGVRTPERNYGPATLPSGVKVTPVARRLAAQAGVDLGTLVGSGPHGHIVARDVQAAAASPAAANAGAGVRGASAPARAAVPAASTNAASTGAPADGEAATGLSAAQVKAMFAGVAFEERPVDGMRRTIARRLQQAKQSIPHFYLTAQVELDRLVAVRRELNAQAAGAFKLSINDFIIRAVALALQRVPQANAVWAQDSILQFRQSDVAVAVAVEGGLFTPVIRQADSKPVSVISREMKALVERAQARALQPADYQGGAITISNLGMYGVQSFSAIVNPPQAAIVAVGALERRAVERADGAVGFASMMSVTLSCDHRVVDGALGARLLAAVKALLEAPLLLLV
jgi:pyruvate dehydrogenase E2 component (dihydrolipoamide acetyltransferase)